MSYFVKTSTEPIMYVHYDPPSKKYLVQLEERGACVFTRENALHFIASLEIPKGAFMLEELPSNIKHLPPNHPKAIALYKELQDLPGYTKK